MAHVLSPMPQDVPPSARPAQAGLWIGVGLILAGPVVGMLSTVVGMADSYHTIESVEAPTPGDLAVGVRISTFGTVAGLTLSVIGLGLLAWTLIQSARFPCAGR